MVANRSESSWSASGSYAFALAMSIGDEGIGASSRRSLLPRALIAVSLSVTSKPCDLCIELLIDEDRVDAPLIDAVRDGAPDGVLFPEDIASVDARLRLRTLREKDGKRFSILFVMLWAEDCIERRLFAACDSGPLK